MLHLLSSLLLPYHDGVEDALDVRLLLISRAVLCELRCWVFAALDILQADVFGAVEEAAPEDEAAALEVLHGGVFGVAEEAAPEVDAVCVSSCVVGSGVNLSPTGAS